MSPTYYLDLRDKRAALWRELGLLEFLSHWKDGTPARLLLLHTTDVADQLKEGETPEQFEARMRGANIRLAILYISGGLDAWAPLKDYGPWPGNPRSYAHKGPVDAGDSAFQHRVRWLLTDMERGADDLPNWELLWRSWIREAAGALQNRMRGGPPPSEHDPFGTRYRAEIERLGLTGDERAALDAARHSNESDQVTRALTILTRLLDTEAAR